jgi:hypothetical protein
MTTTLLQRGIRAVSQLPEDRQDLAGELLLALAEQSDDAYELNAEQLADLRQAIAAADRGEFATDAEVAALWAKYGA